ncbi:MAG TPA: hypothetical protein VEU33_27580 [Archangium sp.]|nr:hypothetical protein [Archangium sp.]
MPSDHLQGFAHRGGGRLPQFEHGARKEGYQLLIAGSGDDPQTERELALSLRARRCDALIVASALPAKDPFYTGLMEGGTPVIAVDRALDPRRFVCVLSDNVSAGEALTRSVMVARELKRRG